MKTLIACVVLVAGALLTLKLVPSPPARAQDGGGELAMQVSGAFVVTAAFSNFPPLTTLMTMSEDETYVVTLTSAFGNGDLAKNGFRSPEHGAWAPLGGDRVATTSLILELDANGTHTGTFKVRSTLQFSQPVDGKFQAFDGDFTIDFFQPGQNPTLDPPAVPNGLQGTLKAKRLNVR